MNWAITGGHDPEIEKNNITVKEIYGAQYHRIPFHNIHKVMIWYSAFEVIRKLNYFPVKGGLSPYYSSQTIVDNQPLEYNKHCRIPFVAFVQAKNEKNTK